MFFFLTWCFWVLIISLSRLASLSDLSLSVLTLSHSFRALLNSSISLWSLLTWAVKWVIWGGMNYSYTYMYMLIQTCCCWVLMIPFSLEVSLCALSCLEDCVWSSFTLALNWAISSSVAISLDLKVVSIKERGEGGRIHVGEVYILYDDMKNV